MRPVIKILTRVIVEPFYRQHAGQLLALFFLAFGIVEGSQLFYYHLSLIYGVLGSTELLLIVFVGWTLYGLKCLQFTLNELDKPSNTFLNWIICLPSYQHVFAIIISQVLVMLPLLLYGSAIVIIGLKTGIYLPAAAIAIFLVLLISFSTAVIRRKLYARSHHVPLLTLFETRGWGKSWPGIYLGYISNDMKLIFFVSKTFSLLTLFIFLQIDVGHYEVRVAWMGLLFGIVSHAVLVYEFRKWEDRCLSIMKNLPLSVNRRFLYLIIVYSLLILPEPFMLRANHIAWIDLPLLFAFLVSGLLFLHTFLFEIQMNTEKYIRNLCIIFLITFGVILFQLYAFVPVLALILSWAWYKRYFYSFELGG